MMELRALPHTVKPDSLMFELWDGDRLIAGIYATARGLKIVSKYIENHPLLVVIDPAEPPAILFNIKRDGNFTRK